MRLLIADDDPVSRRMLAHLVRQRGFEPVVVSEGASALAQLAHADPPRLAIVDWEMPELDGVEVCRRLRALDREPYVYIVLLTGRSSIDHVVEGLDAGADDYLTKPYHPDELALRLRAARRLLTLQQQLMDAREQARHQADHDGLTGLWNRGRVLRCLADELRGAALGGTPCSVVLLDIDHFKLINDRHGHAAGDKVLQIVSRRLARATDGRGFCGRYGGEEFLVVAPGLDLAAAGALAETLRAAIARDPVAIGPLGLPVTASLGVAQAMPPPDEPLDGLVARADAALYEAKAGGRDRVVLAGAVPPVPVRAA
jgi:diguanylate cyclase (GGDEF)-like protein